MLGGGIGVASQAGSGSTFSLTIPAGPLDQVTMINGPARAALPSVPDPDLRLEGRILLAEDGPDNQRLICFYLRKAGAEVEIAENGRLAMERALGSAPDHGRPRFDLIIMDMQMPEMDGYTAAATLRARGYSGPIIALTAHAMTGDREKCLASGCDDYLTKPVNRTALIRSCREWLQRPGRSGDTRLPRAA
jgi:CheY-like chemotaxis protein